MTLKCSKALDTALPSIIHSLWTSFNFGFTICLSDLAWAPAESPIFQRTQHAHRVKGFDTVERAEVRFRSWKNLRMWREGRVLHLRVLCGEVSGWPTLVENRWSFRTLLSREIMSLDRMSYVPIWQTLFVENRWKHSKMKQLSLTQHQSPIFVLPSISSTTPTPPPPKRFKNQKTKKQKKKNPNQWPPHQNNV